MLSSHPFLILFALLCLAAAVVLSAMAKAPLQGQGRAKDTYSYQRTPIMTPAEIVFYRAITEAMTPGMVAFPQVSMGAIVKPAYPRSDKRYMRAFGTVAQKRVDFVVCVQEDMRVLALLELDDRSHSTAWRREKDERRDDITSAAGLPTLRIPVAAKYDAQTIRHQLLKIQESQTGTRPPARRRAKPAPATRKFDLTPLLEAAKPPGGTDYDRDA